MFSIYRDHSAMTALKEVWEQAEPELRDAILRATSRVDKELQRDPLRQGESREGGTRILFAAPLAVVFEVDEAKKLVRVLRSWAFRRSTGR
jgi:hypothetical protein